ncbi:hypothetical protein VTO73DRAFT_2316 [Trametes versicolor]
MRSLVSVAHLPLRSVPCSHSLCLRFSSVASTDLTSPAYIRRACGLHKPIDGVIIARPSKIEYPCLECRGRLLIYMLSEDVCHEHMQPGAFAAGRRTERAAPSIRPPCQCLPYIFAPPVPRKTAQPVPQRWSAYPRRRRHRSPKAALDVVRPQDLVMGGDPWRPSTARATSVQPQPRVWLMQNNGLCVLLASRESTQKQFIIDATAHAPC